MHQALYNKWRPRTFDDVVGQGHITETLKRQVQEGRLSHAYLFTGSRGTGKTTCARILARAVNCEHPVDGAPCNACPACLGIENGSLPDVQELDAASNNGVDQVRALRDEAVYTPAVVKKRVYIIDEVHMLTAAAFNALLKILEEPPEHLMFILATTELHKVPATIKSRCQQFAFKRIAPLDIVGRLKYVAGEEHIALTTPGAELLARLADGGMRDALSLLDQCASGEQAGELGEREILDTLGLAGNVETAALMGEIAARDTGAALEHLDRLYANGKEIGSLLNELSALGRDLLIRKTAPQGGVGLMAGGYDEMTLRGLDKGFTPPRLARMLGLLQAASADLARSSNRRLDAELCLIRLCDETVEPSPEGLSARVARLEELLEGGLLAQPVREEMPSVSGAVSTRAEVQPAPPAEEDVPPWDMEPPPLPDERWEEADKPAASPKPTGLAPQPTVGQAARPTHERAAGEFWPGLVESLRGKVPMGEYHFLSNPAMVAGTMANGVLTLWVKDEFTKGMLSKPAVMAAVTEEAKKLPDGPCRVTVTVGEAPAAAAAEQSHDKLDDLLAMGQQFGNIITEE